MESVHIMSRDDNKLYNFHQVKGNRQLDELYTICFREIFREIVTSTLFTVIEIEYLGEIILKEEMVIYTMTNEEVDLMYRLMKGDIHHPISGRKIVNMLTTIWENNQHFQELSYEYYMTDNKRDLEQALKIFYNFNNTIKINSIWDFYRFKLTEAYEPVKNKILNSYIEDVFETNNPYQYKVSGNKKIKSVMFHDKKYQPEIV